MAFWFPETAQWGNDCRAFFVINKAVTKSSSFRAGLAAAAAGQQSEPI
jgi:hypothetical protein